MNNTPTPSPAPDSESHYTGNDKTPVEPNMSWLKASINRLFAFGFGAGLLKPGPGTWGTLLAWGLWLLLTQFVDNELILVALVFAGFAYGVYACHVVAITMGVNDHGGIVWDEIIAFWLVLFVIAPLNIGWQLAAFVLFRFFDIVKPWPIHYFDQRLKNGFGIMWDDIIAALYTLFVIAVAMRILGV